MHLNIKLSVCKWPFDCTCLMTFVENFSWTFSYINSINTRKMTSFSSFHLTKKKFIWQFIDHFWMNYYLGRTKYYLFEEENRIHQGQHQWRLYYYVRSQWPSCISSFVLWNDFYYIKNSVTLPNVSYI